MFLFLDSNFGNMEGEYEPYDHREIEHPTSDFDVMMHLLKMSVGTGVLAMPYAFRMCGVLLGTICFVFAGLIVTYCMLQLLECNYILCRRTKVPTLTYSKTAEVAFLTGPEKLIPYAVFARRFVDGAQTATYYGITFVYVVFIARNVEQLINHFFGIEWNVRIYMLLLIPFLAAQCYIRVLKYLVPFSLVANIFLLIGFLITLYYIFSNIPGNFSPSLTGESVIGVPVFMSTAIFAMEAVGAVLPLQNEMKTPRHFVGFHGVLIIGMIIIASLYYVIGLFGYLAYGEKTEASISLNVPQNVIGQILRLLVSIAVYCSCGINFYVGTEVFWETIREKYEERKAFIVEMIYRTLLVLLSVAVGAAVPDISPILTLIGAICYTTLGLFIPAMLETVTLWDGGLGYGRWRLYKNIFLMTVALFSFLSGTYVAVEDIRKSYSS